MATDQPYLQSSVQLWDALRTTAGLTISQKPRPLPSYDDAIVAELRHILFNGHPGEFSLLLVERDVSIERLLMTFFRATEPFSKMLNRILQMYQAAAISKGDDNLKMVIQPDRMQERLEFDLKEFTEQVKFIESVIVTQNARKWSTDEMWGLAGFLREQKIPAAITVKKENDIDRWLRTYGGDRHHVFPALPPFQSTGIPVADELLAKIQYDLNGFISRGYELFGSYDQISFGKDLPVDTEDQIWPAEVVRSAAHNCWPASLVEGLQSMCERLVEVPDDSAVLAAVNAIKDRVDAFQTVNVTRQEAIEKLLEVLSMPVWKRREAMYAVWVCASALLDLVDCQVTYHTSEGRLEFPFAPRKIATITQPQHPSRRIEFWSELRTPATRLTGKRKGAIQPDYRYRSINRMEDPVDEIIMECKQYKRSGLSNFSSAVMDYARACPNAVVILCNYGPVLDSVLERVEEEAPEVMGRVRAIGEISPKGDGESRLRRTLRETLAHLIGGADTIGWPKSSVLIELMWASNNTDLDLHLRRNSLWTNFSAPQGISGSQLREDQRGDRGVASTEQIELVPEGTERYSIFVHRYSGPRTLQDSAPHITIFYGEETIEIEMPKATGDWWYVADLRSGFSKPIIVNRVVEDIQQLDLGI